LICFRKCSLSEDWTNDVVLECCDREARQHSARMLNDVILDMWIFQGMFINCSQKDIGNYARILKFGCIIFILNVSFWDTLLIQYITDIQPIAKLWEHETGRRFSDNFDIRILLPSDIFHVNTVLFCFSSLYDWDSVTTLGNIVRGGWSAYLELLFVRRFWSPANFLYWCTYTIFHFNLFCFDENENEI
jgi:hypothetical protein